MRNEGHFDHGVVDNSFRFRICWRLRQRILLVIWMVKEKNKWWWKIHPKMLDWESGLPLYLRNALVNLLSYVPIINYDLCLMGMYECLTEKINICAKMYGNTSSVILWNFFILPQFYNICNHSVASEYKQDK